MFVDANGNKTTSAFKHNLDDPAEEKKWIAVSGCNFDPINKTTEQLANFAQNLFVVKFNNVTNPWVVADTSEFEIEVFNKWDSEPSQKITHSDGYFIQAEKFMLTVDPLQMLSYSLSNPVIGEETNLTISFEPLFPIPSDHICYVKYIFPNEVNLTNVDLTAIEATGMMVDATG